MSLPFTPNQANCRDLNPFSCKFLSSLQAKDRISSPGFTKNLHRISNITTLDSILEFKTNLFTDLAAIIFSLIKDSLELSPVMKSLTIV
jgi:hypothetical protein